MDSRIHREVSVRFGGEGTSVPLAYGPEDFDKETGYYHVPVNFYAENNSVLEN